MLGSTRERLEKHFSKVEDKGAVGNPYAMASEHFEIYLCSEPKGWTFGERWPELKIWD